eukprot:gene13709-13831_t
MQEVSRVLSLVEALGIPVLAVPGVEADDVVGSLAVRAVRDGLQAVVVSPDKDFYQLLRPGLSQMQQPSSTSQLYSLQDFSAEYGLSDPQAWVDVKALAGDAGDNIPGVKGVGLKTALQLVQQLGDVESIIQQFSSDEAVQALQAKVKLNRKQVDMLSSAEGAAAGRLARQLVQLVTDLKVPPVRQPWQAFELKLPQDGGSLALQRAMAMNLTWTAGKLQELLRTWDVRA